METEVNNRGNVNFIKDFSRRIEKLKKTNMIECSIAYCENHADLIIVEGKKLEFPSNILHFYNHILFLNITQPRQLEILSIKNMSTIENRYLHFSIINFTEKICFDMLRKNDADEWDIINLSNKFIITKTIGSFLTNKVWAWIDRGREIWKEENYINLEQV